MLGKSNTAFEKYIYSVHLFASKNGIIVYKNHWVTIINSDDIVNQYIFNQRFKVM